MPRGQPQILMKQKDYHVGLQISAIEREHLSTPFILGMNIICCQYTLIAKIPFAICLIAKVPIAKCTIAKIPIAKCPIAKIPIAQCPITKCPIAKCPIAKCPIAESPIAKIHSSHRNYMKSQTTNSFHQALMAQLVER